jgi:hypothetical protein
MHRPRCLARCLQGRTEELAREQAETEAAVLARSKHCAVFQKHQLELKQRKKERAQLEGLQEAAMLEEMASDQDECFKSYASEYIEEYKRRGKPTKPMELNLSRKEPFASA